MSLSIMLRRREIPLAIIIFCVIVLSTDYFLTGEPGMENVVKDTARYLMDFNKVVVGAAMGVGCINLFMIHGKNIKNRVPGRWPFSIYLLVLFSIMFVAGAITKEHALYTFAYLNIYTPANATTYAMTGWYIASSILRALRLKTKEMSILVTFAFIQILIQLPMLVSGFPDLLGLSSWLKTYFVSPVMAAFSIGIALGTVSYIIRVMIGQERTAYGEIAEVA